LYQYQLVVKSKKGGVKFKLESGPKEMKMDGNGLLTWQVPAGNAAKETDVIVTVSDATGQEMFHTFKVGVQ
jgi:hypothetical protein